MPASIGLKQTSSDDLRFTKNELGPLLVNSELSASNMSCEDSTFYRLIDGHCYTWIPVKVTNIDAARRHCLE